MSDDARAGHDAGRDAGRDDGVLYDLAIIGGGINGAGIARDAAGRGAKVVLFERGDLGQGTSSASTKLIHGGLRYLEHYEFGLVRESLGERERLWSIAPHIIHPLRFVLPYRKGLRPFWMLRAGLFLYDHIGGRHLLPPTRTIRFDRHPAGAPLKPQFRTGFEYSDGWVDDARLVLLNARDAAGRGATVLTHTPVTALRRMGDIWQISTPTHSLRARARAIVNAAGPAVQHVTAMAGVHSAHKLRLVRGSHIVVPKLFDHPFAYFFQLPDGRIFFAIPYRGEFTLIGTTDQDHPDDTIPPVASADEIAYLCEGASEYFAKPVRPEDVVWSYSGVRPLIDEGSGKPEAATRGYTFEVDGDGKSTAPMLTVFGGKITTYRHLAAAVMDKLAPLVPRVEGDDWTADVPLPGGDFPMNGFDALKSKLAQDYPFLDAFTLDRIAAAYGTDCWLWLGAARNFADLGQHFGSGLTEREVNWLVEREWARDSDDILWRRSKLGLRLDAGAIAALQAWLTARSASD